jgi:hypothetical protein
MQAHLATVSKLDGVTDQIKQNLAQPGGVAAHGTRHIRCNIARQYQLLFTGFALQQFDNTFDDRHQQKVRGLNFKFARFNFGKIKNVVNDGQQCAG